MRELRCTLGHVKLQATVCRENAIEPPVQTLVARQKTCLRSTANFMETSAQTGKIGKTLRLTGSERTHAGTKTPK